MSNSTLCIFSDKFPRRLKVEKLEALPGLTMKARAQLGLKIFGLVPPLLRSKKNSGGVRSFKRDTSDFSSFGCLVVD